VNGRSCTAMGRLAERLKQLPQGSRIYKLKALPKLLAQASQVDRLYILLTDFDFIEAKISELGPQPLIEDYDLAFTPDILNSGEWVKSKGDNLRIIQSALRLSAHILEQDKTQLAEQLLGRLLSYKGPEIQVMLEQAKQWKAAPWFRPLTPSLAQPSEPLLRTLVGHTGGVNAVAVFPDGLQAVSASEDGTLKVWDLQRGIELHTLQGHTDGVSGVVITPNGQCAVSSSWDGTLKVWDLKRGKELSTLHGHTQGVSGVTVTPDGRLAISTSQDYTRKVWNLETGKVVKTFCIPDSPPSEFPAIMPDGKKVIFPIRKYPVTEKITVTLDGKQLFTASNHSAPNATSLQVWNLEDGEEVLTLCEHTSVVSEVAVLSDGQRAISASNDLKVWDLKRGVQLFTLPNSGGCIESVAVVPKGQGVLFTSGDQLKILDLQSRTEALTLGHHTQARAIAITPDGQGAISGSSDGTLRVWNLKSSFEQLPQQSYTASVNAVVVIPKKQQAISGSQDGTLKVWDLETGTELLTLKHRSRVQAVAAMASGSRFISGFYDGTLKICDLETGAELLTIAGSFAPPIQLTTPTGDTVLLPALAAAVPVKALAVTPDGQRAVSGLGDGALEVWHLHSTTKLLTLIGHTQQVSGVTVTQDGLRAISSSFDGTLRLWDLQQGTQLLSLHSHDSAINAVALMAKEQYAICASHDSTLKVWDLQSRTQLLSLHGHTDIVWAVAVTPDGKRAISASNDCTVKVWDLVQGKNIASFRGESPLKSCAVASDGVTIVAGEESGRVHFLCLDGM